MRGVATSSAPSSLASAAPLFLLTRRSADSSVDRSLHRKRADGNNRRCLEVGVGLDLPCGIVAVSDGKLDIHANELGSLGPGDLHAGLTIGGFGDRVAGTGEEIAQDAAQVFLVLN
jgi:hypothetical protein